MKRNISLNEILGFLMPVIYIGCGIYLLVADDVFNFSSFQQSGLGIILTVYGVFRFYSSIKKIKRYNENEE